MSFKTEIVKNNTELENVKAEVAKLPMADDVKNGKWVWGKYKKEINSVEVRGSYTESKANRNMLLSLGIALFDSNKKYIGKPNEEIFPGGATNVYILAPATDNNGHVIEGETVYHIVSYSMGNPNLPDVKKYNDFTIKYAENFLAYTVSDSETAYPDGGEKDGFWWERVKEGLPITQMGFTKFTYGEFVLSTDSALDFKLTHNLGVKPKKVRIYTEDSLKGATDAIREVALMNRYTSYSGDGREYYFESGVIQSYSYPDQEGFSNFDTVVYPEYVTESIITFKTESYYLLARGKKYYWYALA